MGLENFKIFNSFKLSQKSLYYLSEYFQANATYLEYLNKYQEQQYLDNISKFLNLYSLSEGYFNRNDELLGLDNDHISSVIHVFLSKNIFRKITEFEYDIDGVEECVPFFWITLQIELFRLSYLIIKSTDLNIVLNTWEYGKPVLINNSDLATFAHFIFEPLELAFIIDRELSNTRFDSSTLTNSGPDLMKSKIDFMTDVVFSRTGIDYVRSYYFSSTTNIQNFEAIRSFKFTKDFTLQKYMNTCTQLKRINLNSFSTPSMNSYYIDEPNETDLLKAEFDKLSEMNSLINKIKITSNFNVLHRVIEKFFMLETFTFADEDKKKLVEKLLTMMGAKINLKPIDNNPIMFVQYRDLFKILGLFSFLLEKRLINYKLKDLIDFLLIITNNKRYSHIRTLEKAHLRTGKMDDIIRKQLNGLIPEK